jgi:hypothetical protein
MHYINAFVNFSAKQEENDMEIKRGRGDGSATGIRTPV